MLCDVSQAVRLDQKCTFNVKNALEIKVVSSCYSEMWIQLNSYTQAWIQLGATYSTHNTVMCENYPHFPHVRCR